MLNTWPARVDAAANTFAPVAQVQSHQPPGEEGCDPSHTTAEPVRWPLIQSQTIELRLQPQRKATWPTAIKRLQSREQQNLCPPISNSGLSPHFQGRVDSHYAGEDRSQRSGLWPWRCSDACKGMASVWAEGISNASTCIHSACRFTFYCHIANHPKSVSLEHSYLLLFSS